MPDQPTLYDRRCPNCGRALVVLAGPAADLPARPDVCWSNVGRPCPQETPAR